MAAGKKYNDDIKERAFALLSCNNSIAEVARALNLPYSTVKTWKYKYLAESDKLAQNAENGQYNSERDLAKARQLKKQEFIDNAWRIIGKAQTLMERRIDSAMKEPDNPDKEINIRELSTVVGTLYDKQALANQEATSIVEGGVALKFEDL